MRGEASLIADRASRDSLAPRLRTMRGQAWDIGNELFTITRVLDNNPRLERAFTDVSRSVEDKTRLLDRLIGGKVHDLTMEILTDLVGRRWSRVSDIANAVEDFGVDAMMYYADSIGATRQMSIELAQLQSALLNASVVRSNLSDPKASPEARVNLIHALLKGRDINKVTFRLAEHAACNPRNRRYLTTIRWLINKFSRHMGSSMVSVTAASMLSNAQIDRLTDIYAKKLGHPVFVNLQVDPNVIGGMRIQYGDMVTDNTVVAQLQQLRRSVRSGT